MTDFTRYAAAHDPATHNGPGDGRTTALEIIQDNNLTNKWSDKVVLITGCSSGIGIETAKAMKTTGAKVYVTARNLAKGESALHDILEPGRCELLELKLDSLSSVRACALTFHRKESKLNVLINNAGVMALQTRELTTDGFETQIGTNHFGHFLLFQLLKAHLLAGSTPEFHSRVVNLSSSGHKNGSVVLDDINLAKPDAYSPWAAYANSKTANIWMANEIERRYGSGNAEAMASGRAIHGHSLNPGGIATGLQVHAPALNDLMKQPEIAKHMKSPQQGAATTVWAAVDGVWEGKGGKFLEDVQVAGPVDPDNKTLGAPGHAVWAYDVDGAKKLWDISNEQVQFEE